MRLKNGPPTGSPVSIGFRQAEGRTRCGAGQRANDQRAYIVHDAAGAAAHPLEPDRHGKPDADLQRELRQAAAWAIDVAVVGEVTDFQDGEQHGEQDRRASTMRAGWSSARLRRRWPAFQNDSAGTP